MMFVAILALEWALPVFNFSKWDSNVSENVQKEP
jgi:hypothetical protein